MPVDYSAKIDVARIDDSAIGVIVREVDDAVAIADSHIKNKSAIKVFFDRMGIGDLVENIYNLVTGHKYNDYPAIKVENDSR